MNIIKDFLGQELNIGDKGVALSHNSTSKMVVVKAFNSNHDWRYDEVMRVSPYKIVKMNNKNAVVHGQWKDGVSICPICGMDKYTGLDADIYADWQPKFCPNCGAKMDTRE